MGAKITVDSSTLMNKGLEVIEAHELFGVGLRPDRRGRAPAVGRPQHGRVLRRRDDRPALDARHAAPDRPRARRPAAASTSRSARSTGPRSAPLTFELPDLEAFPGLGLAYAAGRAGGGAPAILSGANEVAVEAFLAGRIPWLGIAETVDEVLQAGTGNADEVADVLEADRVARERARKSIANRAAA